MMDATCVKAHRTASSLNKGALTLAWPVASKGALTSRRPAVCDRSGRPVRLRHKPQCPVASAWTTPERLMLLTPV